jgi:hypothetical protein
MIMGFFGDSKKRAKAALRLRSDSRNLLMEVLLFANTATSVESLIGAKKPNSVDDVIFQLTKEVDLLHDFMLRHSILEKASFAMVTGSPSAIQIAVESHVRLNEIKELIQSWVATMSRAASAQGVSDIEELTMRAMFHGFENWTMDQHKFVAEWRDLTSAF